MKKTVLLSTLVLLFIAGALSTSAEIIYKQVSSGNNAGYLPTYTQPAFPGQMQPAGQMQLPPPGGMNNYAPPPQKSREFGGYSYNNMDRPAPPSFSSDRPDMPPNMGQQFQRPYQTRYNHNY